MEEVLVVGAGHQGMAMAAHLSLSGIKVCLWNRSYNNIKKICETGIIHVNGVISGDAIIVDVSTNIEKIIKKIIMVTVPANAHKDVAKVLSKYVSKDNIIVLNPGRTFGILEFKKALEENGCTSLPIIAETQTIIYTCRRYGDNNVFIYAFKKEVFLSVLDQKNMTKIKRVLPECLKQYLLPVNSWIITSLGNVGMILHCLPVLMNVGWIENPKIDFSYYYDGITPTIAKLLEKLDNERIKAAKVMGVEIESLIGWLKRTYQVQGNNIYECIQNNIYYREINAPNTLSHRYIEEDIPCGLVAIESIGKRFNFSTPVTSIIIDFANLIMNVDYREFGRKISSFNADIY